MLSERQEHILHSLIKEYIDSAEPISSDLLKKRGSLTVSPATIRNELQELTELGYIMQPHTSAGRVPTEKGYKLFIEITVIGHETLPGFIQRKIIESREQVDRELRVAQNRVRELEETAAALRSPNLQEQVEQLIEKL